MNNYMQPCASSLNIAHWNTLYAFVETNVSVYICF